MGMIKEIDFHTATRLCSEADVREGARNLLVNCCEVTRGTELMIVNENGLVDPAVARIIEDEARALVQAHGDRGAEPRRGRDGLAAVLIFIGAKMLLIDVYKIPVAVSLGVVVVEAAVRSGSLMLLAA